MKLSEKCIVPRRLDEAYSLSVSSARLLNVMRDLLEAGEDHLT